MDPSAPAADRVLADLVARRSIPNADAGVALIAAMSRAIREALLRLRVGPGGVPLPDRGTSVVIPNVVSFTRLPPQPSTSAAAPYVLTATFDSTWLELHGLRQSHRELPGPASVRRVDITGREATDVLISTGLFPTAELVRRALADVVSATARLARSSAGSTGAPPMAVTFPLLGVLVVNSGSSIKFEFADDIRVAAMQMSTSQQQQKSTVGPSPTTFSSAARQRHADRDDAVSVASSRPRSAVGSAVSLARSLSSRGSSAAGQRRRRTNNAAANDGSGGDYLATDAGPPPEVLAANERELAGGGSWGNHFSPYASRSRGSRPGSACSSMAGGSATGSTSAGFRRPNAAALQRVMDSAVEHELERKRASLDTQRRFTHRTLQQSELAAVVDAAVAKQRRTARQKVVADLDRQIEEKRAREAEALADRRAKTPVVFPFSDQEGMRTHSRQLAVEQNQFNTTTTGHLRASSRLQRQREWDENAESAVRSRSDVAKDFLRETAARRQQRQELQDAWAAQLALQEALLAGEQGA